MKRGTFIMDGKNSESFHTYIQDRPLIETPLRKVEWKSGHGVDGDIPFDEEAYENTDLELIIVTNGNDLIYDRERIYDLLDTKGKYRDLIPYFDPGKIYRVQLNDKIQFENKWYYRNAQAASVKFTVKPYKYLVDSETVEFSTPGHVLRNPARYVSQPTIRINGTGDITLIVNQERFNLRDVSGHIVLDSERYLAYVEGTTGPLRSVNDKVLFREYPILRPGTNLIEVEGTVTKTIIQPKWRSLV